MSDTIDSSFFTPDIIQQRITKNPFAKLSDIAKDIIEEAILKMHILPGEKINMTAISKALNLSRTSVRDALNELVTDGLVVVRPDVNGFYAINITDQYISDFFSARSAVEVVSAKICATRFHSIDLAHLKQCCECFQKSYHTNDYETFVKTDREFHECLISYTQNSFLSEMYSSMSRTTEYYSTISRFYLNKYGRNSVFNNFANMVYEHIAIYNAINMGMADTAAQLAQQHLDTCYSSFVHYYFSMGLH